MPGKDEVYVKGKLGIRVAHKICHGLGYSLGKFIRGPYSNAEESPTFSLKPKKAEKNFCMKMFSEIVDKKDFSPEKLSKIKNQCISLISKNHVQIECRKQIQGSTSVASQSTCGDGEFCPTGFSNRKNSGEESDFNENTDFCLPNRCYCENGLAATQGCCVKNAYVTAVWFFKVLFGGGVIF